MEAPFTMRRAAEFSLAQIAEHHTAGFEGYVLPVHVNTQGMVDRLRSDDIDLWRSLRAVAQRPPGGAHAYRAARASGAHRQHGRARACAAP